MQLGPQVDTLLDQLEGKFDEMNKDVLSRREWLCLPALVCWDGLAERLYAVNALSTRIDGLERQVSELVQGTPSES
jgi:hypothetical protein